MKQTLTRAVFLALLAALSAEAAGRRFLLFGGRPSWVVFDTRTRTTKSLLPPPGQHPVEVALSPDGTALAYTARAEGAVTTQLYLWLLDGTVSPRLIGDSQGYHADPRFDDEGKWVLFAHNGSSSGSPMDHRRAAYAQLYRVRVDGTGLVRLTDEAGCHFSPAPLGASSVVFVHAACVTDSRAIEILDLKSGKRTTLLRGSVSANEMTVDPIAGYAVFAARSVDLLSLWRVPLNGGPLTQLEGFPRDGFHAQPQFGSDHHLYFVRNDAIWQHRRGTPVKVAKLPGGAQ